MNLTSSLALDEILHLIQSEYNQFESAYADQFNGEMKILAPDYQLSNGKHIRPVLFFLAQGLLGNPDPQSIDLAVMVEMLHDASLLHDDVVDEASVRRGHKTLHRIRNSHYAVLFGDYVFAKVLSIGVRYGNLQIMKIVSDVVMSMSRGVLHEYSKMNVLDPTYYVKIAKQKTAHFFGAICEIAAIVQNSIDADRLRLRTFGENFGLVFQIHDDILDYTQDTETLKKSAGQDVQTETMTLPFVLAANTLKSDEQEKVLKTFFSDSPGKGEWIRSFVLNHGGIEEAQNLANSFAQKAELALSELPESNYLQAIKSLMDRERCRNF